MIYEKIYRTSPRAGKEIVCGVSLDKASCQKKEWVSKITVIVMFGLFLLVIFKSHY